jgi:hypothetical protein
MGTAMAQKARRGVTDPWLATLIDSFEATRSDGRDVPCDRALLRATREHLSVAKSPIPRAVKARRTPIAKSGYAHC